MVLAGSGFKLVLAFTDPESIAQCESVGKLLEQPASVKAATSKDATNPLANILPPVLINTSFVAISIELKSYSDSRHSFVGCVFKRTAGPSFLEG
ncbi:hypothetical protein D3C86_1913020 [compost metagenome]